MRACMSKAGRCLRHQCKIHERCGQPGLLGDANNVAVKQQGGADANGRAMHGGNDRFVGGSQTVQGKRLT